MNKIPRGRNDGHTTDYSQITNHIYVGSNLCKGNSCPIHSKEFEELNICVEINLDDERKEIPPDDIDAYIWLPVIDGYAPNVVQFDIGTSTIHEAVSRRDRVYVHCKNGHGRSPTLVVAYLVRYQGFDLDGAIKFIQVRRPEIHIEKTQKQALKEYSDKLERKERKGMVEVVNVIPAILTNNEDEFGKLANESSEYLGSYPNKLHIDVIDGVFAENISILPDLPEKPGEGSVVIARGVDIHLMVNEPIEWIAKCSKSFHVERIIGHVEMMSDQEKFVEEVRNVRKVGLAIDLDTPISRIADRLFNKLDLVLVMSVKAGFGGQKFNVSALEKVKHLNHLRKEKGYKYKIGVDGGVTPDNIKLIVEAGADEVCVGRRLFDGDLAGNIQKYLKAAYKK